MKNKIHPKSNHFHSVPLKRMLYLSSVLLLLFLSLSIFATASIGKKNIPANNVYQGWILDKTVDNVEFYHMLADCNGKTVVLLKIINRNKGPVAVSWKEIFETQVDKDIEGYLGEKKINLKENQTIQGDCLGENKNKAVVVLPGDVSPAYEAKISNFSYKSIIVTK